MTSQLPPLGRNDDPYLIAEKVNVLIGDYNGALRVPPGVVLPYAGSSAPTGFLLCDGSAVSRTVYTALFSAIGTTYGVGDGSTTFNVPDLRGRVAAGKDDMGGSAANRITNAGSGITGTTLGASGGAETHTLTVAQMPSHAHPIERGNGVPGVSTPRGVHGDAVGADSAGSSANVGGGGAHNNTQPTLILNHIIAT